MEEPKILVVDDDIIIRDLLKMLLEKAKYKVDITENVDQAIDILEKEADNYFLVMSDYDMPGKTGIELLEYIKGHNPVIEVVIITGAGSEDVAIRALRLGALNYIKKPVEVEELLPIVQKARELNKVRKKNVEYFNEILKLKDEKEIEVESFKIFIEGMEEELAEKYSYLRKAYFFLKKLDPNILKPELRNELNILLDENGKKKT